ncbi:hypothetical protein KUTeg_023753 [Tegillarca granosa]|uniref:Uncharacterized protein n=1 Tax=Tegillarca granosa TaxID=220873 RepID=A0ABQ9E2L4_TEGGR|nr:hypothetical protein KUTeg_023753 [Tegillarca granosa]
MVSFTNLQYFHSIFDGVIYKLKIFPFPLPFIVNLYDIYFINFSVQVLKRIKKNKMYEKENQYLYLISIFTTHKKKKSMKKISYDTCIPHGQYPLVFIMSQ